ncbi:hypothetical protein SCANM63S_01923 [Streptomyces canarius]
MGRTTPEGHAVRQRIEVILYVVLVMVLALSVVRYAESG